MESRLMFSFPPHPLPPLLLPSWRLFRNRVFSHNLNPSRSLFVILGSLMASLLILFQSFTPPPPPPFLSSFISVSLSHSLSHPLSPC